MKKIHKQIIAHAGEDSEKGESLSTDGTATFEIIMQVPLKMGTDLPHDLAWAYTIRTLQPYYREICLPTFIAALLISINNGKHPRCSRK